MPKQSKADMDRVFVYKNLLAAEDHLKELIDGAESSEEKLRFEGDLDSTIWLRDAVMPDESDSRAHCLVKHYAAAYEGACEVWKETRSDSDKAIMDGTRQLLNSYLEFLWGKTLINCERCHQDVERRTDQSIGRNLDDGTSNQRPRWSISSIGGHRGFVLPAGEIRSEGGQSEERGGSETEEGSFGDVLY